MVKLITVTEEHQILVTLPSGNFAVPEMLAGEQKHSCQLYLCKGIISAVTKLEMKVKLLLYCTLKIDFTVDHQALLHSLQKKVQIFFLTFLLVLYFLFSFLIGLWEFPFGKTK